MSEVQTKPEEKLVAVINQRPGRMDTAYGSIPPGGSLAMPESAALKMTKTYKGLKLLSDIVPGAKDSVAAAAENAALKRRVTQLEGQLAEINTEGPKAVEAARAEGRKEAEEAAAEKIADLTTRLSEFVQADKKDLKALQDKHAEAVEPAKAQAGAAA